MHKFFGFISTNTGSKLFCITDAISETQVKEGTITSPFPFKILSMVIDRRLAEEPELTKTLYFTPSHFDQAFSKATTFFDCVKILSFFLVILIKIGHLY